MRELIHESELLDFIKNKIPEGKERTIYLKETNEKISIKKFQENAKHIQ